MEYCVLKTKKKGFGVFSNKPLKPKQIVGEYLTKQFSEIGRPVTKELWETELGRYCNHSSNANTHPKIINESIFLVSDTEIKVGDEITVNYRLIEDMLGFERGTFYSDDFNDDNLKNFGL